MSVIYLNSSLLVSNRQLFERHDREGESINV
jgi:hypothetical protein